MKNTKLKKCMCNLLAILIAFMMMLTGVGQEEEVMAAGFYYGDIDENGYVEPSDALDVLKHCVNLIQITDEKTRTLADMNGDKSITAEDALMILKTCVNLLPLVSYDPAEVTVPDEGTKKVLVAYFSATGTTEGIAEHIANGLNADIYEIVPAVPYTSADLNYGDSSSRTSIEMNDPNSRPAISGSVENMEQYDIVFLGYPIWWGQAPKIISTFLESYDFSGKTIVPFCTSGSSEIGSSATNLRALTPNSSWLAGQRFGGSASSATVMEWVNSLAFNLNDK